MNPNPESGSESLRKLALLAIWFGLVTGLVEGLGLMLSHRPAEITELGFWGLEPEIIWISPFFCVLLFSAAAGVITLTARVVPSQPTLVVGVFVFHWMATLDWLLLTMKLRHSSALLLALGLAAVATRDFRQRQAERLRFLRKSLPVLVGAIIFACLAIEGGTRMRERIGTLRLRPAAAGAPNVLIIVVDTLRADHLSSYGYTRQTSRHIDSLAAQGVRFDNGIATSSWTVPSHASLLTGRYADEHGTGQAKVLDRQYPTLGEMLQALGYRTATFSANTDVFVRSNGFGRGFLHFEDRFHSLIDMGLRTLYGRKINLFVLRRLRIWDLGRKRAADVNRAALKWIDKDTSKPFFVFLNYYDVHDQYLPPEPYRSKFKKFRGPGGILHSNLRHPVLLTSEMIDAEIAAYDGAIAYVDDNIDQLFEDLRKRGSDRELLVIITSDHGESFGEHGLYMHWNALYREVLHVPLVIWWPGKVPQGVTVDRPVSIAAIPATVLDLIGARHHGISGRSLAELWREPIQQADWPEPLAELEEKPWDQLRNPVCYGAMKSVFGPRLHYIQHEKFGAEVYDWIKDPQELNNISDTAEGAAAIQHYAELLKQRSSR